MDGTLDVWDFVFKQTDPTLTLQVRCISRMYTFLMVDWL